MKAFSSLRDAMRAGFHVHERTAIGYTMRARTAAGDVFATVTLAT